MCLLFMRNGLPVREGRLALPEGEYMHGSVNPVIAAHGHDTGRTGKIAYGCQRRCDGAAVDRTGRFYGGGDEDARIVTESCVFIGQKSVFLVISFGKSFTCRVERVVGVLVRIEEIGQAGRRQESRKIVRRPKGRP